ncbi:unnamed protein product [Haemonchus placei]|uniref:Uncharacterized protein n=1 Tax=Haemonchus placei TaxID=6290 RepID=A0A0N4X9U3_HAEPC|nr:unnamed protein product [Haemonchus placei]
MIMAVKQKRNGKLLSEKEENSTNNGIPTTSSRGPKLNPTSHYKVERQKIAVGSYAFSINNYRINNNNVTKRRTPNRRSAVVEEESSIDDCGPSRIVRGGLSGPMPPELYPAIWMVYMYIRRRPSIRALGRSGFDRRLIGIVSTTASEAVSDT